MLSGLDPADQLREYGIEVAVDLPWVGQNLQDHPDVSVVARANGPYGYYNHDVGWKMLRNGLQFKLFGSGRITTDGASKPRCSSPPAFACASLASRFESGFAKLHKRIGTTIVYVTHDQVEAMTLADRIVIMRDGYIEQEGTPLDVFEGG